MRLSLGLPLPGLGFGEGARRLLRLNRPFGCCVFSWIEVLLVGKCSEVVRQWAEAETGSCWF